MERDKNKEVSWNIYMIQWGRKFWVMTPGIFSATGLWCVYVKVTQLCLTLGDPRQCMEFSRPEYWRGLPFPSLGDLPNPGIEPRPFALQADSLPAEPPGKPKNTGIDSLSLLQGIFPTQELNWGLLHGPSPADRCAMHVETNQTRWQALLIFWLPLQASLFFY